MLEFELSQYQKDILDFVENKQGNLLVNAKAGSGKTSTLVLISEKLLTDNKKMLFLAFNKSIVEELGRKLTNPNCQIKTIHSTGLTFIRSYLYKKHNKNYELEVTDEKTKNIVKEIFEKECLQDVRLANMELSEDDFKDLLYDLQREILMLCNFCRFYMVNYHLETGIYYVLDKCTNKLRDAKNYGITNLPSVVELIIDEIKNRFEHPTINELTNLPHYEIDYVDMIYFPLYYNMYTPFSLRDNLDYVMIDESQDLSILQQMFVKKLNNGRTRFIFVGDEKQAIYGFAGADTQSINNIKKNFVLTELPLNICYRCPEKVIKVSKSLVPEIEWNKNREDTGKVDYVDRDKFYEMLESGDMILARKNKDLVKIYRHLVLDLKKSIKFKNRELVNQIVSQMKTVIKEYVRRYNKRENIEKRLYKQLKQVGISLNKKKRNEEQQKFVAEAARKLLDDEAQVNKVITKQNYSVDYLRDCMLEYKTKGSYDYDNGEQMREYFDIINSFIDEFKKDCNAYTVKTFITYLEKFLSGRLDDDSPILSTIHMMKGSEADRIFIYDYPYFPYKMGGGKEDMEQQEANLQYVAMTRAKKELYLVDIGYEEDMDDEEKHEIDKLNDKSHTVVDSLLNKVTIDVI